MKGDIYERAVDEAIFIIENQSTVRATAKKFGVSKSTVHKDVTERLQEANRTLHSEVRKVLDINLSDRARRGGQSTKMMYKHKRTAKKESREG
jgi:putative DeoR family transcriptional regulator (stage III sporulation protein D)